MKPASDDLKARRPLWKALSELYADPEAEIGPVVRAIVASPYSMEEAETVLVEEVHPACYPNSISPGGVWAAFDEEWLESAILAGPAKMTGADEMTSSERWKEVRRRVAAIRDQMSAGVRPSKCACGSARIATILYGELALTPDLKRQIDEGQIVSGGCLVYDDMPLWRCVDCGKEYR